ncbi:MAG TPA: hypothetical protein QGF35_02125 [Dehalococcoidia bacterium]|nr:hypothetical protein [Dehalococcoidia bacterium]
MYPSDAVVPTNRAARLRRRRRGSALGGGHEHFQVNVYSVGAKGVNEPQPYLAAIDQVPNSRPLSLEQLFVVRGDAAAASPAMLSPGIDELGANESTANPALPSAKEAAASNQRIGPAPRTKWFPGECRAEIRTPTRV